MTDIPTITQEEAVEVRARLAAIVVRHTKIGGYPDTHAIAADAFELGRALSPNMDHAVGGVRRETLIRAMYEAWPHTVTSQALNELTGLPYGATIPYGMAQRCGASFVALERYADGILALSATTPPVNQDAVREAGQDVESRAKQIAHANGDPNWWNYKDAAIAALATPPLDNTGLDAATMERPDGAIENLTNFQQQADMHGEFVKVSRQALDETLAYVAALASGDRS